MMKIPRTIDDPLYFLIWRFDDAILPIFGVIVGILSDQMLLSVAVGVGLSYFYRRYREGRPEMFLMHALYGQGFWPNRGHAMVHPFIRRIRS